MSSSDVVKGQVKVKRGLKFNLYLHYYSAVSSPVKYKIVSIGILYFYFHLVTLIPSPKIVGFDNLLLDHDEVPQVVVVSVYLVLLYW